MNGHGRKVVVLYGLGETIDAGQPIHDELPGGVHLSIIESGLSIAVQPLFPLGTIQGIDPLDGAHLPGQRSAHRLL